jgi:hypothetical protein
VRKKKHSRKVPSRNGTAPGFSLRERAIYEYWNGERKVRADPDKLRRDLLAYPNLNLERDVALLKIESDSPEFPKEQAGALDRLLGAVRQAFDIKPFKDLGHGTEGLTESECIDLFGDFGLWVGELKKKRGILPTSPTPTDSAPSSKDSTTQNTAGCGGIETACSPDGAKPLP